MIIIKKGPKDSIDKMLKKYKRKSIQYRTLKDLKERQEYEKPSSKRRKQKAAAIYREKIRTDREKRS
jgi:small subunit ribosomal protein S21